MGKNGYTVEEVCERMGVTPRTLHYYEEIGLIQGVPRTDGGHRYFDDRIVERLEFVLKLKDLLGISLQEVKAVVDLESRLDRIRVTYHQVTVSPDEKIRLLDEAVPIFEQLIARMDTRVEKLQTLRESFAKRLARTIDLRHTEETGQSQQ